MKSILLILISLLAIDAPELEVVSNIEPPPGYTLDTMWQECSQLDEMTCSWADVPEETTPKVTLTQGRKRTRTTTTPSPKQATRQSATTDSTTEHFKGLLIRGELSSKPKPNNSQQANKYDTQFRVPVYRSPAQFAVQSASPTGGLRLSNGVNGPGIFISFMKLEGANEYSCQIFVQRSENYCAKKQMSSSDWDGINFPVASASTNNVNVIGKYRWIIVEWNTTNVSLRPRAKNGAYGDVVLTCNIYELVKHVNDKASTFLFDDEVEVESQMINESLYNLTKFIRIMGFSVPFGPLEKWRMSIMTYAQYPDPSRQVKFKLEDFD